MKVFFDYQAFNQEYGGISRYFCELIKGINKTEHHQAHLSLLWSNNSYLDEYNISIMSYPFPKKHRIFNKTNQLYNRVDAKISKYDIYHATYFDDFLEPYIGSKPFVTTFYDMTYERLSYRFKELSNDKWIIPQKKKIAKQASHLIAISESTKQDMIELLDVAPEKITVIHLGSSFSQNYSNSGYSRSSTNPPYLLYVGKRYEYKNFLSFLRAVTPVLIRHRMCLICAGGGNFTHDEKETIQSLSLNELVKHKEINDAVLQDLYEGATAFIFPSLYEGFGIPILEAFVCNCPCVISNISSLPEVAGDAALYMDPMNSESMSDAVETIILDNEIREKLIERGRQRLLHFSWQRTVKETVDLYERLV